MELSGYAPTYAASQEDVDTSGEPLRCGDVDDFEMAVGEPATLDPAAITGRLTVSAPDGVTAGAAAANEELKCLSEWLLICFRYQESLFKAEAVTEVWYA
ncbi:hypothetical protein UY3_00543 [Chelonia mydas]|uniref:Uncharacterized protein n=1 Tax=Chelonia mydas TaxID=8469 RepID=M7BWC9_CHEMY|nr:hypothetical protein UY3_00543 [Chelonia mydas]